MAPTGRSWARAGLDEAAYSALAVGLAASELWSLLLGVAEQRVAQRTPAHVRQQWERDRFVCPAYIDQRTLNELDRHLLAAASAFEALELSPLAPLGSCSAIGLTSQNKIVTTFRGTEVVSDPTNSLALESARRLRANPLQTIKLATNHLCVRAQQVPNQSRTGQSRFSPTRRAGYWANASQPRSGRRSPLRRSRMAIMTDCAL
jgi:hypothetical protein